MILPDTETNVDLLNNEAIAQTIVTLLHDHRDHPVTIGVHGDWGAGKSSVLEMIDSRLAADDDVLCLKFNGWRFQGFEDAKIALIEGIVAGLIEKRPLLTKASDTVKEVFRRIDWLKLAKKAGGLALTAYTGIPSPDIIASAVSGVRALFADPAKVATLENVENALAGIESLIKPGNAKHIPEEIAEFRKAFDDLLKAAGIKQLVVLIDDLDRCLPDTAIETLEAVRLFVFTAQTAFVVAADEAMIEYAVRKHFPDLPDSSGPRDYARNYLEKLIQVPFRIPALGETETRAYVTLLLIGAEVGTSDTGFIALVAHARELLKRPWKNAAIDSEIVRATLGASAPRAQNQLVLSEQIAPILAGGTRGNPRQIKRFLNTLLLRQRTADARGFGTDVNLPVLAKLMLAERFFPRVFDQIAASAVQAGDGRCVELKTLEAAAHAKTDTAKVKRKDGAKGLAEDDDKAAESLVLAEWLTSPTVVGWAAVNPSLADVDLRPYLFVAKDRKDYFGVASALGPLAAVVEQLFGPKLAVQALDGELRRLAGPEADKVFEAIRSRVLAGDALDTEPPGMAGMVVLVKAHPALQTRLLDFLEGLPTEKLGPWAIAGWEGVVRDPDVRARLTALIASWAVSAKNPTLKTAAAASRRVGRGSH
jgi:hypothetical protein